MSSKFAALARCTAAPALVLVLAACSASSPPKPIPSNTVASGASSSLSSTSVKTVPECFAIIWGYDESEQPDPTITTVTISIIRKFDNYEVRKARFDFGDGGVEEKNHPSQDNLSTTHTYRKTGTFIIKAFFMVHGLDQTFACPEEDMTILPRQ